MEDKFHIEPDQQISFLNKASGLLDTISDILMKIFLSHESKGSWPFETDSQAEEMLKLIGDNLSSVHKKMCRVKEPFARQILQRTCTAVSWASRLLVFGRMFVRLAKSAGEAKKATSYLYDTYEALALPSISLQFVAEELSIATKSTRNGSVLTEEERQRETLGRESGYLPALAGILELVSETIADFKLPEGNRKDFAAMCRLLYLEYELSEVIDKVAEANRRRLPHLIEEVEIVVRVVRGYVRGLGNMLDYIEMDGPGDWIADQVANVFAKANERRFEIENLAAQLNMAWEEEAALGAGPESISRSELPKLTDTESYIIEALGNETLKGPDLLKKAGYDNSSHYRQILSNLVKRAILHRNANGYYKNDPEACQ